METEFIPYEQALALKELGFDEPCFGFYNDEQQLRPVSQKSHKSYSRIMRNISLRNNAKCTAPLYQQAFRWFRENHQVRGSIMDFIDDGIEWDYEIATIGTDLDENGNYKPLVDYSTDDEDRKFKTYKEAELECLKKLIEIVKQK